MSLIEKAIIEVYSKLESNRNILRSVTKILNSKLVVRLSRRHKYSKRNTRNEFVLTFGRPNYRETNFIKACKKRDIPYEGVFKVLPVKKRKSNAKR